MANTSSSLRGGRSRKFKSEINVVPYIDVMLVLLVIFMVAAPLTNPSVINLPQAEKSSLPPTEYVQITLKPDGNPTIGMAGAKSGAVQPEVANGRADLMRKLAAYRKKDPKIAVMIAADKEIRYDEVIQTISEAKKLGVERVGLATR
jgi:biopolymer transport protein TolR